MTQALPSFSVDNAGLTKAVMSCMSFMTLSVDSRQFPCHARAKCVKGKNHTLCNMLNTSGDLFSSHGISWREEAGSLPAVCTRDDVPGATRPEERRCAGTWVPAGAGP